MENGAIFLCRVFNASALGLMSKNGLYVRVSADRP